jgi:hypothetical protein
LKKNIQFTEYCECACVCGFDLLAQGEGPNGRASGSATFVPSKPSTTSPPPAGVVQGKIFFYGGGDDQTPAYDDLHVLDTGKFNLCTLQSNYWKCMRENV